MSHSMHAAVTLLFVVLALGSCAAEGAETQVDVRVISKGAKFIGTSMGGVEIVIADAATGQIVAQGKTAGSTGDTEKIMKAEQRHHAPVSTPDAAVWSTKLDLRQPRRLVFTARGPLAQPQAIQTVSVTQWLIPGKHLTGGDGVLLELPGLVVDVLQPPAHLKYSTVPQTIEITANVTMMCGCPIEPGGLWDADKLEVAAIVERNDEPFGETELKYAGQTSQFAATLKLTEPGSYLITVYAYDRAGGNTGLDRTSIIVPGP